MEGHVEALIERARKGDRAAFDDLSESFRPRLEGLLRGRIGARIRARVEIQDLVQETLLRAWGSISRFRAADSDSFFRWIAGIALHVLLETLRQAGRGPCLALDFDVSADDPTPSDVVRRRERRDRFDRAIAALSPDHRTALRLVRIEGLSVAEAARRMNRSPNAISQLLIRALRKLREGFGDTESFHLPAGEALEPAEGPPR